MFNCLSNFAKIFRGFQIEVFSNIPRNLSLFSKKLGRPEKVSFHRKLNLDHKFAIEPSLYAQYRGFCTSNDQTVYERACEETLESLTDFFEDLVENHTVFSSGDVSYSDGVLTINLGKEFGTYVINRQSPNQQIWLSSPISGPKRYDLTVDKLWIYKHDGQTLHSLLQKEMSKLLQKDIDLSQCSYYK